MKFRKMMAIMLVSAMAVATFAGCGESSSDSSDAAAEETTEAADDTAEAADDTAEAADDTATAAADGDIFIGVSLGTLKQERWAREADMFQDFADENGYDISIQSANEDTALQVSQCENLITQGIDVLVLQPLDGNAVSPIIEAAHEAGIKVISYDRLATNCDLDYYVTFDTVKVGEEEAKFVLEQAPTGNYIWLLGGSEDFNSVLLEEGQHNVLDEYIESGDINIVLGPQNCDGWDPEKAMAYTEEGLTKADNDIQAVLASNDGTCGGAVQALEAQGLAGEVATCGQDADLAACQRIVEGTQTGTVFKPTPTLNQAACELAVAIAQGEEDPLSVVDTSLGTVGTVNNETKDVESFNVDVIPVTADNMYDVIIKQYEYHTLEEVYANVPEDEWPAAE